MQLSAVADHGWRNIIVVLNDLYVRFSELWLEELESIVEELVNIDLDKVRGVTGAGKIKQIADDIRGALGLPMHFLQKRMLRVGLGNHAKKHLRIARHACQRRVDLVSDAGSEQADAGELFALL